MAALQRQLELLDEETFGKQRSSLSFENNPESTLESAEISMGSLRKRLLEVQQKMMLPKTLSSTASALGGGVKLRPAKVSPGVNGDEAFEEDEQIEDSNNFFSEDEESDVFLDGLDLKQIIGAARKDVAATASQSSSSTSTGLEEAFKILSTSGLPMEERLGAVQQKLQHWLQQDQYWRSEASRNACKVHDLKLQKRLSEIERDRLMAVNSRLEGFCRDLQQENRKIKMESARLEEALKHNSAILSSPTMTTITPASTPTTSKKKEKDKNATSNKGRQEKTAMAIEKLETSFNLPEIPKKETLQMEDKETLIGRINGLVDLYQCREQHYASIIEGRDLEAQLCETKVTQQQLLLERTIQKLDFGESRVNELARNEADLKAQVRQYVEKFKQVEETLVKSNELFGTFRGEMEQMSVKLGRLERENNQMHNKCATLSRNIIEMADERTKLTASIETLKTQKGKLEQLCRTLQAERNAARNQQTTSQLESNPSGENGIVVEEEDFIPMIEPADVALD